MESTSDCIVDLPKPPSLTTRRQLQNQTSEPLDCPRCGSSNTKFCYYNNYNKSQPRHFCKACKRHWTKGGTLRNVPVGGGRKNKRLKASTSTSITTTISDRKNHHHHHHQDVKQNSHHYFSLPPSHHLADDQKKKKDISDILYRALIINSSSSSASSVQPEPIINESTNKTKSSSMLPLPPSSCSSQDQNLQFSFSSLSHFDSIPSPIPTNFHQSLNGYYEEDYCGGRNKLLDSTNVESSTIATTTTTAATTSSGIFCQPPWQLLGPLTTTSSSVGVAELQNYCWNWNDIDTLVSADLNIPWDDNNNNNNAEVKP